MTYFEQPPFNSVLKLIEDLYKRLDINFWQVCAYDVRPSERWRHKRPFCLMTFYVCESSVCLQFEEGFLVWGHHEERWLFNGGRTIVHEAGLFLRSRQFSSYIVTIWAKATRRPEGFVQSTWCIGFRLQWVHRCKRNARYKLAPFLLNILMQRILFLTARCSL